MQDQIERAQLTIRKMTPEERAEKPPRPRAPRRRRVERRAGLGAGDVQPVLHETRDRIITGIVTAVPFLALGVVCWQVWADLLRWSDVVVFAIMYVAHRPRRDGRLPPATSRTAASRRAGPCAATLAVARARPRSRGR